MTQTLNNTNSDHHRIVLGITGMSCGACATKIENKLNALTDIKASVNYATKRAIIDAPPSTTTKDLISVVNSTGFSAHPYETSNHIDNADQQALSLLGKRLVFALITLFPLADLSMLFASIPNSRFYGWQWVLLTLATPVVFWCAYPFHRAAVKNLIYRTTTMDTLISIGVLVSYIWSIYTVFFIPFPNHTMGLWHDIFYNNGVYLEVCAGVTVFALAGKYWESKARIRSLEVVRTLENLNDKRVAVVLNNDEILILPREELKVGQKFIIGSGSRIGADGIVTSGTAAIDSSAMTGETKTYIVEPGNKVFAGTKVIDGPIIVTATHTGDDTQLAAMIRLVHQAQLVKSGIHKLVDKISAIFVPIVIGLSCATFLTWFFFLHATATTACSTALSVLVIACPCALGLATPTALLVATSTGTRLGIYIRSQEALETIRNTAMVVFDKTGTLTTGELEIYEICALSDSSERILELTAALEAQVDHPLSTAIRTGLHKRGLQNLSASQVKVTPGLGISGQINEENITIGTAAHFKDKPYSIPTIDTAGAHPTVLKVLEDAQLYGHTVIWVGNDYKLLGIITLSDTIRDDSTATINTLHQHGIATMILSGDSASAVAKIAKSLKVSSYQSNLLPADKAEVLIKLKENRSPDDTVIMVGDGINDAPALATADLGIAIGRANDIACAAADIIIVSNTLSTVLAAMDLAKATVKTIHTNLFWALSYNIAALPLAACGILSPIIASAAMAFSSFFVVANSLRLEKFQTKAQLIPQ